MIILQTIGGGGGFSAGEWVGGNLEAQCTTFRDNSYIHLLNRALQAELRLVSTYAGILTRLESTHPFHHYCSDHQRAAKDLVRLVISNHGIPEENSALNLGLTKTFVQLCSAIPGRLLLEARRKTLVQLERHQVHSYQRLLIEAPGRDVEDLNALLSLSESHLEQSVSAQNNHL